MKLRILTISLISVMVITICPIVATAKTIYVEKWGADTDSCGAKTDPCSMIGHAVENRAKARDRIIVGPGVYAESLEVRLALTGLRLESSHGRHGTVIEADSPILDTVRILAEGVRFGRKGKGFTVKGAFGIGSAGIRYNSQATGGRIEGNKFEDNHKGIQGSGERVTIRDNIVRNNVNTGIICNRCSDSRIQQNQVEGNGANGIYLHDSTDSIQVSGNRIVANGEDGFVSHFQVVGLKLFDNQVESNLGRGVVIDGTAGLRMSGNVIVRNQSTGVILHQSTNPTPAIMKNNLVMANHSVGLIVENTSDIRLENTMVIQNSTYGIYLDQGVTTKKFANNSSFAKGSGCGLFSQTDVTTDYSKHFFGAASGPDDSFDGDGVDALCGAGVATGSHVALPQRVRVNKAASL